jgi:3-oxoacyl-[acyl-carrier-protein] synthase II
MKHLLKENKRRVVVTGMSTVNPLGQDLDSFWTACKQGTSGIKKIEAFSVPDEMSQIAGIVEKLDISSLDLSPVQQVSHDRSLLFALKATTDALEQAGLGEGQRDVLDNSHCAVVVANAISQIGNMEKDFCNQTDSGKKPLSPAKKTGKAVPNSFFFRHHEC